MTTEKVKLVHKDRVNLLLNLLQEYPEDVQCVFDLTFVALVVAESQGIEVDSLYAAFSRQYPLARRFVDNLTPESI